MRMLGPLVYETRGHESEGCPPSSGVAPSESEWATLQLRGYPALLTRLWVVRSPPSHPGSWPCSVGCRRGGEDLVPDRVGDPPQPGPGRPRVATWADVAHSPTRSGGRRLPAAERGFAGTALL